MQIIEPEVEATFRAGIATVVILVGAVQELRNPVAEIVVGAIAQDVIAEVVIAEVVTLAGVISEVVTLEGVVKASSLLKSQIAARKLNLIYYNLVYKPSN
ncbi:unnamed protein product [Orchesella dallaii]|uniref:Uncharacterized protein n=1 Tax=Orchesella dallaii TaxID=48710 RepID=A0ABP1RM55_9HEXA